MHQSPLNDYIGMCTRLLVGINLSKAILILLVLIRQILRGQCVATLRDQYLEDSVLRLYEINT